jgi:5-methylcytosine-specific restriction protein A
MPPTAEEFRQELYRLMYEAVTQGQGCVDINAGELHRRLDHYPGPNHRMPNCCQVMKGAMDADYGDVIVQEPASVAVEIIAARS